MDWLSRVSPEPYRDEPGGEASREGRRHGPHNPRAGVRAFSVPFKLIRT